MAKKQPEAVGLDRGKPARPRRFPWWAIVLIVLILLVGSMALYAYWPSIKGRVEEAAATPLPEAPGELTNSDSGELYATNFDTDVTADWEPVFDNGKVSASFDQAQGVLVIDVDSLNEEGTWLAMNYSFKDFVLDVDATKTAGEDDNTAIVLFRLQDDGNYYRFDISYDGFYSLSRAVGSQQSVVSDWNRSDAIKTGNATNHIQIWAQGGTFRFFVNDTQLPMCVSNDPNTQPIWDTSTTPIGCLGGQVVQEWSDTTFAEGKIGLGAQAYILTDEAGNPTAAQTTVTFDNLNIRKPEAVQ